VNLLIVNKIVLSFTGASRYQTFRMEEQENGEQDKEMSLLSVKEIPDQSCSA
jgi:hypothetical protein